MPHHATPGYKQTKEQMDTYYTLSVDLDFPNSGINPTSVEDLSLLAGSHVAQMPPES